MEEKTIENKQMGILKYEQVNRAFDLKRIHPSTEISDFIKHYWIVRWNLPDGKSFTQALIPNPCVNIVFEKDVSGIYGINQFKTEKLLQQSGMAFGIKFKPGGFRPFYEQAVATLTNKSMQLEEVFDIDAKKLGGEILAKADDNEMVNVFEKFLKPIIPTEDKNVEFVNKIIDFIYDHQHMFKVSELCEVFQINERKLQRLFRECVGVSPKWVIKLYRLQQAAEKIERAESVNLTFLSHELGYYDQSHFTKDFKKFLGKTPSEYKE